MNPTQIGISTASPELISHIRQEVVNNTNVSDLADIPPYAGEEAKFLGITNQGSGDEPRWLTIPPSGIRWRNADSNVTAETNGGYLVSGGITISLMENPVQGDVIAVADDYGITGDNPITVRTTDGSTINGSTELEVDMANVAFQIVWDETEWRIVALNHPTNIASIEEERFAAGQREYTLSRIPPNSASLLVVHGGEVVPSTEYVVNGNTLTFDTARISTVSVRYLGLPHTARVADVPVGFMGYFPNNEIPDGWLRCNGGTVTSSAYPDLVRYLNKSPNATSAILPDARGKFVRSWDSGYGIDTVTSTPIPRSLQGNGWGKWLSTLNEATADEIWNDNLSTGSTVKHADGYIGYAFDIPVKVNQASIYTDEALGVNYNPDNILLEFSDDGVAWTAASAQSAMPVGGSGQIDLVSTEVAEHRFWRIRGQAGLSYPGSDYYWNVRSVWFTGSTTSRIVGDEQAASTAQHEHVNITAGGSTYQASSTLANIDVSADPANAEYKDVLLFKLDGSAGATDARSGAFGGTETRPDNINLVMCIKAFHEQSGTLSVSDVTQLRNEVSALATQVQDKIIEGDVDSVIKERLQFTNLPSGAFTANVVFEPGQVEVYLNGIKQIRGIDFTENLGAGGVGESVTMVNALVDGDNIEVYTYNNVSVSEGAGVMPYRGTTVAEALDGLGSAVFTLNSEYRLLGELHILETVMAANTGSAHQDAGFLAACQARIDEIVAALP